MPAVSAALALVAGLTPNAGRVAVYVPTTVHAEAAPKELTRKNRNRVREAFAKWFGGYTEVRGSGGYWSEEKGRMIRERVYIVYAAADPAAVNATLPDILTLAKTIGRSMAQEVVAVEVNGTTYFVPPHVPAVAIAG